MWLPENSELHMWLTLYFCCKALLEVIKHKHCAG